jgi:hypothetical protein
MKNIGEKMKEKIVYTTIGQWTSEMLTFKTLCEAQKVARKDWKGNLIARIFEEVWSAGDFTLIREREVPDSELC